MKITREKLKQIIKEELEEMMVDEAVPSQQQQMAELERQLATFEKYSNIPAYAKRANEVRAQIERLKGLSGGNTTTATTAQKPTSANPPPPPPNRTFAQDSDAKRKAALDKVAQAKLNNAMVQKKRNEWKALFNNIKQLVAKDTNDTVRVDTWPIYKQLMSIDTPPDQRGEAARKGSVFNAWSLMNIESFKAGIVKDTQGNTQLAFYAAPTGKEPKGPSTTPVDPNKPILVLSATGSDELLRNAILKQPEMKSLADKVPGLNTQIARLKDSPVQERKKR